MYACVHTPTPPTHTLCQTTSHFHTYSHQQMVLEDSLHGNVKQVAQSELALIGLAFTLL